MSTTAPNSALPTSVPKAKKKHRTLNSIRKHRRGNTKKAKRNTKPIGLPSTTKPSQLADNTPQTSTVTTNTSTFASTSNSTSNSISNTPLSQKLTKESQSRSTRRGKNRRKQSRIGISSAQKARQQSARNDNYRKKLDSEFQKADDIRDLGTHTIHIHTQTKGEYLRINGNIKEFQYLKVSDILEINSANKNSNALTLKISNINLSGATNWHLSIDSVIAQQWNITSKMQCNINLINPLSLELSQIEITFKNQYISRGKLWKVERDLINRIVHVNECMNCKAKGYELNITLLRTKGSETVSCGLITANTTFVFRSNSAWFTYLIQLSKEMWDFNKKQIHFEKFIDGFLKTIMAKWEQNQCNHVYSIIFFSRTFYESPTKHGPDMVSVFNKDSDNRYYMDHYMVVVRNSNDNNWSKLSKKLREAFDIYPLRVKWLGNIQNVSIASEGNILEAIQLALNVLDKHYINRDLYRTGMSITVVTAGNGLYFVNKSLAAFTKVRILNNGINCDIVSMSRPPLHPTPLFVYGSPFAFESEEWKSLSYAQPTEMMQIKFFDYNPYNESPIVSPSFLYTKIASFLHLQNESKTFVPLSLGMPVVNTNNNGMNSGFHSIYLQSDIDSSKDNLDEFERNIFCNPKRSLNAKRSQKLIQKMSINENAVLPSVDNHEMRFATINKRNSPMLSPFNDGTPNSSFLSTNDIISKRMFNLSNHDLSNSEDTLNLHSADDGNEPSVPALKAMFNAPKEDGDNINEDNQAPNVQYMSDIANKSVIVIQHKDSYHQHSSIKHSISALDASHTPIFDCDREQSDGISDMELENKSEEMPLQSDMELEERESETNESNKINPFKSSWSDGMTQRNRRFRQVCALPHQYCGFLFPSYNAQWKTFISPSILPLTNDTDFKEEALECSKNVYKSNWQIGAKNDSFDTLNEMVLQRLTQDFQIMKRSTTVSISTSHVLNTQTYIHKLKQRPSETNISIKRYVDNRLADKESNILLKSMAKTVLQKRDIYEQVLSTFSLPYNYNLWNDHRESFQNYTVKLAEQHQLYQWYKLDQVCAGYCDDIENDLKARRIRFALIPSQIKDKDLVLHNFIAWFCEVTNSANIAQTGIQCINNKRISYNEPSTWNWQNKSERVNVLLRNEENEQIGFDSTNEWQKTQRMKIKLESEWKGRDTFLIVRYDIIYDPNVVFHFQIYWLIATGNQIKNFIDALKREANKRDLHLMPVPAAQPKKIADPFSKTLTVESQCRIKGNAYTEMHLQRALINEFGFVLDTNYPNLCSNNNTALQFMHKSGCAILRWHDEQWKSNIGFTWVPNNYKYTLSNHNSQFRQQSIHLFQKFRRYFHNTIEMFQNVDHILSHVLLKSVFHN